MGLWGIESCSQGLSSIAKVNRRSVLLQMFDNISRLRFQEGSGNEMMAGAMISSEGEVMDFRQPVAAEGRVEDWMTNVLNEMRRTNRLITKEAIYGYCHETTRLGGNDEHKNVWKTE